MFGTGREEMLKEGKRREGREEKQAEREEGGEEKERGEEKNLIG